MNPQQHLLVWCRRDLDGGPTVPIRATEASPDAPFWSMPPGRLRCEAVRGPVWTLLRVEGTVEGKTLAPLRAAFLTALAQAQPNLLLDLGLADVSTVDWVPLASEYRAALEEAGGRLVLVCPGPDVRGHLEILGLDGLFPVASSVDEAVTLL